MLVVRNPPSNVKDMRDQVQYLGWEDPLEEGMGRDVSFGSELVVVGRCREQNPME